MLRQMKGWTGWLAIVLWIALCAACGEEAPPPPETGSAKPAPAPAPVREDEDRLEAVTLGTGIVTGDYYLMGDAIAAMLNKRQSTYHLVCMVEATGGSLVNIHAVLSGDLQFGFVRGKWSHDAAKGIGNWKGRGAQKDLRSVLSLPFDSTPPTAAPGEIGPAAPASIPAVPAVSEEAGTAPFMGTTTLVTSAKVPERIVYHFTKAIFENLSKLQEVHPAFVGADPQLMLQGLAAPIHPGALRYYQEAGWK